MRLKRFLKKSNKNDDNIIKKPKVSRLKFFSRFKNKQQLAQERSRAAIIKLVAIILAIVIIISLIVFKVYSGTEVAMTRKLDSYARKVFKNDLEDKGSQSYTINLNYLENHDYNVSQFKDCDKTGTYVVIIVNGEEIISSDVHLSCKED